MKKVISLFLSVVMATSVFSGLGISAFAAVPENVRLELTESIEMMENIDGYWDETILGEKYFVYFYPDFSEGDKAIITMSDSTEKIYTYQAVFDEEGGSYYDFIDNNGEVLNYYIDDNQAEEPWSMGNHYFDFVVYFENDDELRTTIPVLIIESTVAGAEFSISKLTVIENTNGYWVKEENKYYFQYFPYDCFAEGDTLTIHMKDGSQTVYTYQLIEFTDEQWSYYAFADEDGNTIDLGFNVDEQIDNHWGIGSHEAEFTIREYGEMPVSIIIEITPGSQETCWHDGEWKVINGIPVKKCVGCGYELKLPFKDLRGYEIYFDYITYTSIYNSFIAGTNPPEYTEFSPRNSITRAMLIAIIYRMAGNPYENANPHTVNPFTDINANAYYYDAACWALDKGITNQLTFKPNDKVTREQTARFLFAYAESENLLGDNSYKDVDLSEYPDYKNVHSWAVEPLKWANYNDMITGTQQGYINPQGSTQRIHASRILFGFGITCDLGNF